MSPTTPPIRLFLVDDHQLFRSGLRAELEGEFEIVGEAGDVDQAVAGIATLTPDVVLLDVHLPFRRPVLNRRHRIRLSGLLVRLSVVQHHLA